MSLGPAITALMGRRNSSVKSSECASFKASSPTLKAKPARMSELVACLTSTMARIPSPRSMPPKKPVTMSSGHVLFKRSEPLTTVVAASASSASSMSKSVLPRRRRCWL